MGILGARRGLEWLLGFYFLSHVPITLLFDMQSVLPREFYPIQVRAPVSPGRGSPSVGPVCALRWRPASPRLLSVLVLVLPPLPSFLRSCRCSGLSLPLNSTSSSGFSLYISHSSPTLLGANTLFLVKPVVSRVCLHQVSCQQTYNLGMFPDWGSNLQPFGVWDDAPTHGATQPGHICKLCFAKQGNIHRF